MVIGPKLKARNFPNQKTEIRIGTNILNKMNGLGRAKYELLSNLVFEYCWSCGNLVGVCGFDSVFERDACDDFCEVVKAA